MSPSIPGRHVQADVISTSRFVVPPGHASENEKGPRVLTTWPPTLRPSTRTLSRRGRRYTNASWRPVTVNRRASAATTWREVWLFDIQPSSKLPVKPSVRHSPSVRSGRVGW